MFCWCSHCCQRRDYICCTNYLTPSVKYVLYCNTLTILYCFFIHQKYLAPTGAPEHFNCTVHNSTSLQLGWRQPSPLEQNGPLDYYLVFVWNMDTNEVVYSNSTPFSKTAATILVTALLPYHNYKCSVAAYGRFGLGPFDSVPVWIPETGKSILYFKLVKNPSCLFKSMQNILGLL